MVDKTFCFEKEQILLDRENTARIVFTLIRSKSYFKYFLKFILSSIILEKAYSEIKKKSHVLNLFDKELKGIYITKSSKKKLHIYRPIRELNIPQLNKSSTGILSIISVKDKIIQYAFKHVLEILCEGINYYKIFFKKSLISIKKSRRKQYLIKKNFLPKIFSNRSHAFRPKKSSHTAIKEIKTS